MIEMTIFVEMIQKTANMHAQFILVGDECKNSTMAIFSRSINSSTDKTIEAPINPLFLITQLLYRTKQQSSVIVQPVVSVYLPRHTHPPFDVLHHHSFMIDQNAA
jgi:hypothetical protein